MNAKPACSQLDRSQTHISQFLSSDYGGQIINRTVPYASICEFTCMGVDPPSQPAMQVEIHLHGLADPPSPLPVQVQVHGHSVPRGWLRFKQMLFFLHRIQF